MKIRLDPWRNNSVGSVVAGGVVVIFCLLLLGHDPLVFWNDDYELSILPVFADVARSWSEGHLPLLSPFSWVCSNLAGEFQYGTFSVFVNAAVILIWKFPLTFSHQAATLSITHLFVLGAGAFLLARHRRFSAPISLMVALVAALNGWIICWGASDWFGALGAFAWLPWAWWGLERALGDAASSEEDASPRSDPTGRGWRCLWPAPFVYFVVAGGFPYTVVMLGLIVVWLSLRVLFETRKWRPLLPMLGGVALGFGLSAPALLALFDYVQGSGRGVTSANAHLQWLVPPASLVGFILPAWMVNWADFMTRSVSHTATELACGFLPPVALISGIICYGRRFVRQIRWDLILLLILLSISMLPSAGVFRWSFRWLPLIHLVLALCAAEALRFQSNAREFSLTMPWARPGVLGLIFLSLITVAMLWGGFTGAHAFPLTWIIFGIALVWAACDVFAVGAAATKWLPPVIVFAVLLATYWCIPPNCGVPKYNLAQELTSPAPLDSRRLYLSVYPWAEENYRLEKNPDPVGQVVRPGSTSMWGGLRFVNGYSPILAAGVGREFGFSIHGELDPSLAQYLISNQAGPAGILEQLGVDGIVVSQLVVGDPPATDWNLVFSNKEGRVFHRRGDAFPLVRSVPWIDSLANREFATASISQIQDERNSLTANVDVPATANSALLIFSKPFFRGYEARIGDQKLPVISYRGLIPMIEVPAGEHGHLVLTYRPWWLIWGGAIAGFSLIVLIIGTGAAVRQSRSR